MAKHFEVLMAATNDVYEKTVAVVNASTPIEETEARKRNVIDSLPPKMKQQVIEIESQLGAE
jgi:hypothetical protein